MQSIIILSVNGLHASVKTQNAWTDTKTRRLYWLSTRDPPQTKRYIQTESEGLEKYIPCKWKSKESRSSNTHIRKKRLENEDHYKVRQRGTLNNNQGINPRRYASNIGAPQHINHMPTTIKEEIDSNTIIVGNGNTTVTSMDKSSRQKISKETQAINET